MIAGFLIVLLYFALAAVHLYELIQHHWSEVQLHWAAISAWLSYAFTSIHYHWFLVYEWAAKLIRALF